jgi:hypothetical protein
MTFLFGGLFRKVVYAPPRRCSRCALCTFRLQASKTGKFLRKEIRVPKLAFPKRHKETMEMLGITGELR